MLQYFNFKGQRFEAGQEVEVADKGHAVVVADNGKGTLHLRYDTGEEDKSVNIKNVKPSKKQDSRENSSIRSVSSTGSGGEKKSSRVSMFSRFTSSSKSNTEGTVRAGNLPPAEESIAELESSKFESDKKGKRRGSGELLRKGSNASLGNTVSPRTAAIGGVSTKNPNTNPAEDVETTEVVVKKKKKPVRKRVLTDVEVRVIERIRKCHEQMQGNVFKSALDLSLLQLKFIPSNCHELYYIRELNVRKNEFTSVYDAIFPFPHLTKLDISYNYLLPPDPSSEQVSSANSLDGMSDPNPEVTMDRKPPFAAFVEIPVKLTFLDLSGTNLKALPEELRILSKSLQILIIRKNKLSEFPNWFGEFKFLQKLDCADNDLVMTKALSHLIEEELPKLSDLNLDRNPCIKTIEEDKKDGKVSTNEESLIGNKMRYLLQKRELYQSKESRKACVTRALDIKSRLIMMEKNKILADVADSIVD